MVNALPKRLKDGQIGQRLIWISAAPYRLIVASYANDAK